MKQFKRKIRRQVRRGVVFTTRVLNRRICAGDSIYKHSFTQVDETPKGAAKRLRAMKKAIKNRKKYGDTAVRTTTLQPVGSD
jgi:hypothetical protein